MTDVRRWRVPGRVNLVGEHLDYNGGPSLPFAIDRSVLLKARRRDDDTVNVWSGGEKASFPTSVGPGDVAGWSAYVAGAVWSLTSVGHDVPGVDLVLESDLPTGAGLSSSAALTCGVISALDDFLALGLGPTDVALAAQRVENDYVGAATGLMDQLAVMHGQEGHAVWVEPLAEPPVTRPVPLGTFEAGLVLLVIGTGVQHDHAESGYAERRAESALAAEQLGLPLLAKAGPDAVLRLEDDTLKRRTRHVITETTRVRAAARVLAEGSWEQLGTILTASHESMRDDYEISCAELDVAVEAALEAGALGARMTGGGFGGSAIALVAQDRAGAVRERVERQFGALGWQRPDVFAVRPSAGAYRLD